MIAVEAFGAVVQVRVMAPELRSGVTALLPPGARPRGPDDAEPVFSVRASGPDRYDVAMGSAALATGVGRGAALGVLDSSIRLHLSTRARSHVLVHAGAVAFRDRAIVLPGRSRAGKSTLVAALLRAGATYYSDELAALDDAGLLHPYPRPLSLRDGAGGVTATPAGALGAATGVEPRPVALIAIVAYAAEASWNPEARTPADGVVALMANTAAARSDPERVLGVLCAAAGDALVLEAVRGEADAAAAALLAAIR